MLAVGQGVEHGFVFLKGSVAAEELVILVLCSVEFGNLGLQLDDTPLNLVLLRGQPSRARLDELSMKLRDIV